MVRGREKDLNIELEGGRDSKNGIREGGCGGSLRLMKRKIGGIGEFY